MSRPAGPPPRRADQEAALGYARQDVPWDARPVSQGVSMSPEVEAFVRNGGKIKKVARGQKTLNERQVELLCRAEYSTLAVEAQVDAHVRKHMGKDK